MVKITQKQLIEQIKGLKEIKPRQGWVILAKSQIFDSSPTKILLGDKNPVRKVSIFDVIKSINFQKKLAYSFATLVFVIVGLIGFAEHTMPGDLLFPVKKIAEQSEAALIGHPNSVARLSKSISDLAQVAKEGRTGNIPSAISEVNANASQLAKDLKNNLITDSETIEKIAVGLQTLAYVSGTDLSESMDIKDLYRVVAQNQIADLEKATLTEEQEEILAEAKDLYEQEKYKQAFEKILMINKLRINE